MDNRTHYNRSYSNGEITVYWQPKYCIHAGNCFTLLPNVFKPADRPWIDLSKATTDEIIEAVDSCPTDALTYIRNTKIHDKKNTENVYTEPTTITSFPKGPFIICGKATINNSNGELIKTGQNIVLCGCGKSKNKPFCDGSHKDE